MLSASGLPTFPSDCEQTHISAPNMSVKISAKSILKEVLNEEQAQATIEANTAIIQTIKGDILESFG
jgi:hypothetical protein